MYSVSGKEKWSYAVGNMPFAVKDAAFANFVVFYYTQVQGLSGTLSGLALFIALCWDAVSDPVVGSWSDSFRSRWGRRHPLLVAGALPTALLFLALFAPPEGLGDVGIFLWLLCVSILLRTFLTIYYIPYTALGAELSTQYDERTLIAKARITMAWFAGMALPAIAFALFFPSDNGVDGRLLAANYTQYGVLSAVVAALTALVCIVGTWSVIPRLPNASHSQSFSWRAPLKDMSLAFANRNFRISMGATLALGISTGVFTALMLHMGTYFWEFSTEQLAGMVVPTAIGTLVAFFSLRRLGQAFDKPILLAGISLVLAVHSAWFIGARLIGLLPANGHDIIYPLFLLSTGIGVFLIVSIQSLSVSFTADILDEQEVATGKRQEGVMFAAGAFVQKATIGFGIFVAGIVIDLSGFKAGAVPGEVTQSILNTLGGFTLVVTVAFALLAFLFNSKLRLSREDHARFNAILQNKTSAANTE